MNMTVKILLKVILIVPICENGGVVIKCYDGWKIQKVQYDPPTIKHKRVMSKRSNIEMQLLSENQLTSTSSKNSLSIHSGYAFSDKSETTISPKAVGWMPGQYWWHFTYKVWRKIQKNKDMMLINMLIINQRGQQEPPMQTNPYGFA